MEPGAIGTMSCHRWRRILFLWIDREREQLPFGRIERHLHDCPECRERARRTEKVVAIVRSRCRRADVPAGLLERIRITIETD